MARSRQLAGAAVTALALVAAAPAQAQSDLYNDFQTDGQIDACAYDPGTLQDGLNNLPPDLQQYAPGFADQLRAGLEAQCGGGAVPAPGEEAGVPVPGGTGGGPPTTTRVNTPAAPKPSDRPVIGNVPAPGVAAAPAGSDPPGGLLPLLAIGAALVALLIAAGSRFTGFGLERITRPLGVSFSDAGARTGEAFAFARDVVRFGR